MKYTIYLSTGADIDIALAESELEDFRDWLAEEAGADIVSFGDGFINRKYIVMVLPADKKVKVPSKGYTAHEITSEDVATNLLAQLLKEDK